jgi:hypothetical protein
MSPDGSGITEQNDGSIYAVGVSPGKRPEVADAAGAGG